MPQTTANSWPLRIGPLARLPLFLRLSGRSCLVVGGGEASHWKAEALAACGARVTIVDPMAPAARPDSGIIVERRAFRSDDVQGKALVVVATPNREANQKAAAAARAQGIPVNIVDAPEESDVIFPSIVNRGPVLVAISTEAAAPVLARQLRRRIEAILPETLGEVAHFAAVRRPEVKAAFPEAAARRQFWERFFEAVFTDAPLTAARIEGIYRRQLRISQENQGGAPTCVHVLETPARPDDLSLLALRLLNAADTLVFDAAVNNAVIGHARREARHILLGAGESSALENALDDAAAEAGAHRAVVWLRSAHHPPLADFTRLKQGLNSRGVAARHLHAAPPPSD